MSRIVVSVSNDLVTDQRVKKICQTLFDEGFEVLLIGRKLPESIPIERPYKVSRMKLFFRKKFWFYMELNIRLFFKLLFTKKDILLANDLDTLLPNYLISLISGKKLVYDSHEFFTESPELIIRPKIQKVWLLIEKLIFPKLKNVITVNDIIARIYQEKYKVPVNVIRNISPRLKTKTVDEHWKKDIKKGNKMLIIQGTGINKDRGAEEAVAMMEYLEDMILIIVGGGDVIEELKLMIKHKNLEDKVKIFGKVPYEELLQFTLISDLCLSLDKGTNLNYEYSLPNKVFDFIQCQIPLMVSNRKIVADLVEKHQIGIVFREHDPLRMAETVKDAFKNKERYDMWKKNLISAAELYSWELESEKLIEIYKNLN